MAVTIIGIGGVFFGVGIVAYNPIYRHFMKHDSFSPFKTVDGYGFVSNNPIMNTDPTGHMKQWAAYALGGAGMVIAIISAILLPVASVAILPAIGIATTSTTTLVTAIAGATVGALGTTSGALQIASTSQPKNKNLAYASLSFGVAGGIASVAAGAMMSWVGVMIRVNGVASAVEGVTTLFSALMITSGVSSFIAGETGGFASGMGLASTADPSLAQMAGWNEAMQILGGLLG